MSGRVFLTTIDELTGQLVAKFIWVFLAGNPVLQVAKVHNGCQPLGGDMNRTANAIFREQFF